MDAIESARRWGISKLALLCCCLLIGLGFLAAASAGPSTAPVVAAECEGDECQAPPPPPDDPMPATAVVQGPPNPLVRFPKPQRKPKGKKGADRSKQDGRQGSRGKSVRGSGS